ncbi:MAG: ABC transporter permease subunit [Candidatus Eremiobacteraeota bacterium]|nr:ABC transporter permease subunit [Candidatus Eremiobacteraeota bacterium]MCW5865849.1 ABC transporter permease subunit [Candidatus Eremiobacteraeota bacterium]
MRRFLLVWLLLTVCCWAQDAEKIRIGSKAFPESWVLGEAAVQLARSSGAQVEYTKSLGATEIIYAALKQGSIDVYPEYTGTIRQVFLKQISDATDADALELLARDRLGMSYSLGFTDSYALAVPQRVRGPEALSDLPKYPDLRYVMNQEFMGRQDGWSGLSAKYGLKPKHFSEMQHELCYRAVEANQADIINVYTTDAQIEKLGLRLLRDDQHYFSRYDCVWLYRADLPQRCPKAWAALQQLVGRVSEEQMRRANARMVIDQQSDKQAAEYLLQQCLPARQGEVSPRKSGFDFGLVLKQTGEHLKLVAISLSLAVLVGVPLGILASRSPVTARLTLSTVGLLQTIPSLALLAFMIPITGTGPGPAVVALFVYSILPIVRNTYTGLTTLPGNLSEAAHALGMPPLAQLWRIRLPMASPSILAGIKTSSVINVGTATLAALVGAGGLGQSILQGISLLDNQMIFQGAIPAAMLALLAQAFWDVVEKWIVPRGLRIQAE